MIEKLLKATFINRYVLYTKRISMISLKVVTVKKISSPSNEMLEKSRRIVICDGDQFRHVLTHKKKAL